MSLFASTKVEPAPIIPTGGTYLGCASDPDAFVRALDGPSWINTESMVCDSACFIHLRKLIRTLDC